MNSQSLVEHLLGSHSQSRVKPGTISHLPEASCDSSRFCLIGLFIYSFCLWGRGQMPSVLGYPWRPERATECSGAEVPDSCKPPDVDTWN